MSEANWCVGWRGLFSGGHDYYSSDKKADRVVDTVLGVGAFMVRERLYCCRKCHGLKWFETMSWFEKVDA